MRRVRMLVPRTWQNAGQELQLAVGLEVDLPSSVADSFLATGVAEAVAAAAEPAPIVATPPAAATRERKPAGPREVKRGVA